MTGFQKAQRKRARARLCFAGPSGSGKTYTALHVATGLAGEGGKIALLDTENGSAELYADDFDFDVLNFNPPFTPERYIEAIEMAEQAGYNVLVIDSLSHEWNGSGGILEIVDEVAARSRGKGRDGWKEATPRHTKFLEKIVRSNLHVVATVRSKTAYEWTGERVVKLGLEPIQRAELEYEMTIYGDIDREHRLSVTKSRMRVLQDAVIHKPDASLGRKIAEWLGSAEAQEETKSETGAAEIATDAPKPSDTAAAAEGSPSQPVEEGASTRKGEGVEPASTLPAGGDGDAPSSKPSEGATDAAQATAPSALSEEQEHDEKDRLTSLIETAVESSVVSIGEVIKASMGPCSRANVSPPRNVGTVKNLPLSVLAGIVKELDLESRLVGA